MLGVFLAFFPVALGTLRGLQSAQPASLELMDSFARRLVAHAVQAALPAAVPFIAPALRIAGASAVVGVIVVRDLARRRRRRRPLILAYGQEASSDPAKLYTAVFGAAVLGLVMSVIVVAIDRRLMRHRPQETA